MIEVTKQDNYNSEEVVRKIYYHRVFSYNFGGLQKVLDSIDRNIRLESVVPYSMYEGVAVLSEDIADDPVSDLVVKSVAVSEGVSNPQYKPTPEHKVKE